MAILRLRARENWLSRSWVRVFLVICFFMVLLSKVIPTFKKASGRTDYRSE